MSYLGEGRDGAKAATMPHDQAYYEAENEIEHALIANNHQHPRPDRFPRNLCNPASLSAHETRLTASLVKPVRSAHSQANHGNPSIKKITVKTTKGGNHGA